MNGNDLDSLISAAVRIDDLAGDYRVSNNIEKEAQKFIEATNIGFYFYDFEKGNLYKPLNINISDFESFQDKSKLLLKIVSEKKDGLFNEQKKLEKLENCFAKKKAPIKNLYAKVVFDYSQVYGLLVAFNVNEKNKLSHFDFFSKLIIFPLRRYKFINRSKAEIKENNTITALNQSLFRVSNLEEFFKEAFNLIDENLESSRISIILKEKNQFVFVAGHSIPSKVLSKGEVTVKNNVLEYVYKNKKGVFSEDIKKDARFGGRNKNLRYRQKSFICVPLLEKNKIIGFLSVSERSSGGPFKENDFSYLSSFANVLVEGMNFLKSKKQDFNHFEIFTNKNKSWFSQQEDFSFSERTFSSNHQYPLIHFKEHSPKTYTLLGGHLFAESDLVLEYQDSIDSFLIELLDKYNSPSNLYKSSKKKLENFFSKGINKENIKISMFIFQKERKNAFSYLVTKNYCCLHFKVSLNKVDVVASNNTLIGDTKKHFSGGNNVFCKRDDIIIIYTNDLKQEDIKNHLKQLLIDSKDQNTNLIKEKILSFHGSYFNNGESLYIFKIK